MSPDTFQLHLRSALSLLTEFTGQFCYNTLAKNYAFIIQPSGKGVHEGMDEFEKQNLIRLNRYAGKQLSEKKVIALLCHDDKVPLWINMTVYESKRSLTVIHLMFSRRLRHYDQLNHLTDKYPPFHPLVPMPPEGFSRDINGKFDINWKKQSDYKQALNRFWAKLREWYVQE